MKAAVIALFIVYHILHLTTGTVHPSFHANAETHEVDVYRNLVDGFQRPLASGIYILAMLAIGLHLSHGLWSMLQTIGVNRPNWEPALKRMALLFAVVCVIALADRGKLVRTFRGVVEGKILEAPRGIEGFGYDPLFYYRAYGRSFGEISLKEKMAVSHRGKALTAIFKSL